MKTIFAVVVSCCAMSLTVLADNPLQIRLDAAHPGDVVVATPGVYAGPLVIPDGVVLSGAGAEVVVLDGEGATNAVVCGKNAVIAGVAIRNARVGVYNQQNSMGVFECAVSGCLDAAIDVRNGCAVLVNNHLEGNAKNMGVRIVASNPYLSGNTIAGNQVGVWVCGKYIPSIVDNDFIDNQTAIQLVESTSFMDRNGLMGNRRGIMGGADAHARSVPMAAHARYTLDAYLRLMSVVLDEQIKSHPIVVYELDSTPGEFGVKTLFPWSDFTVGASTLDTRIAAHSAYDMINGGLLTSTLLVKARPTVAVSGPEQTLKQRDRYALDQWYVHPESYKMDEQGRFVFTRFTSFSRIEVAVPAGYMPVEVSHPFTVEQVGGQTLVTLVEVGLKTIRIILEKSPE